MLCSKLFKSKYFILILLKEGNLFYDNYDQWTLFMFSPTLETVRIFQVTPNYTKKMTVCKTKLRFNGVKVLWIFFFLCIGPICCVHTCICRRSVQVRDTRLKPDVTWKVFKIMFFWFWKNDHACDQVCNKTRICILQGSAVIH